ncbi:MAG: hypothetical protein HY300_13330 [Verrucomicrobia bacterium]|nr:hypothetical protein [Verrucomicrobiota bacterium]
MVGAERDLVLHRAEPFLPVNVRVCRPFLDRIIPLALGRVAHVGAFKHDELADGALPDDLRRLVPLGVRAALRSHLKNFLRLLNRVVNPEGLSEIARHRLLDVNVFARFHRVAGTGRVPVVHRCDHDGVNVLSLNQLPVVVELKVVACDPGVKGNSATGRTKPATLETGLVVQVPEYLAQGEIVKVDTRTGEFLSRA